MSPSRIAGRSAAVLAIVCSAQLVLAVDITIILVANVAIKHALGFGEADLAWLVTAYAVTFGGLLLLAGRLADALGHRRMFLTGLAAFAIASAGAALSASPAELVLSRAAQGLAAAAVSPAALALLGDEFTDEGRRGRAFGFWAASGSAGGVVGYTVGGALVGYLGWRWAFIINLPICAAGLLAGLRYLPAGHARGPAQRLPALGAASVTLGLGLLIYALGQGQSDGWTSGATLAGLGGAALCIGVFVVHEAHSPDPLIALEVIRRREAIANVPAALQAAIISAAVFLGSLYLQQVLGDSPQQVGVATLPVPLGVATGAYAVTRLRRRLAADSVVIVAGFALVAAGLAWIGFRARAEDYWTVLLPGWAALGFGLAISQIPLVALATSNASEHVRGTVAGVYNMSQQTGTALGLTAFTIVAVAFARGAGPTAARLHGLQIAILAAAGLALAAAVFAAVTGRRTTGRRTTGRRTTGRATRRRGARGSGSRKPEYPLADDVELDL